MENQNSFEPLSNHNQSANNRSDQPTVLNQSGSLLPNQKIQEKSKSRKGCWIVFIIVLLIVIAPVVLVYLTESGLAQTKIDRLYGKTSLSKYWGGLPADTKTALNLTLESMKQMPGFEVTIKDITRSSSASSKTTLEATFLANGDWELDMSSGTGIKHVDGDSYVNFDKSWLETDPNDAEGFSSFVSIYNNMLNPYVFLEKIKPFIKEGSSRSEINRNSGIISVYKFSIAGDKNKKNPLDRTLDLLETGDPMAYLADSEVTIFVNNSKNPLINQIKATQDNKETMSIKYQVTEKKEIEAPEISENLNDALTGSQKKARDSRRRGDLQTISVALQVFADDNRDLVPQTTTASPKLENIGEINNIPKEQIINLSSSGNLLEKALVPKYLQDWPKDPDSQYYYSYYSNGYRFKLWAVQEDKTASCAETLGELCFISVSQ